MRDREERVIYDICRSAQQNEASYDSEVKTMEERGRGGEMRAMEGKSTGIVEKGLETR